MSAREKLQQYVAVGLASCASLNFNLLCLVRRMTDKVICNIVQQLIELSVFFNAVICWFPCVSDSTVLRFASTYIMQAYVHACVYVYEKMCAALFVSFSLRFMGCTCQLRPYVSVDAFEC